MRALPHLLALACGLAGSGCATLGASGSESPRSFRLERDAALLPARTWRLSNLEVERSVAAFTGLGPALAAELPPDVRQEGYTPDVNQDVSSTWAARYSALASVLATRAARNNPAPAGCADFRSPACRARTVRELGLRAFRRPLVAEEQRAFEDLLE